MGPSRIKYVDGRRLLRRFFGRLRATSSRLRLSFEVSLHGDVEFGICIVFLFAVQFPLSMLDSRFIRGAFCVARFCDIVFAFSAIIFVV